MLAFLGIISNLRDAHDASRNADHNEQSRSHSTHNRGYRRPCPLCAGHCRQRFRPHAASGELGYHVLDTLVAIEESAATGEFRTVASSVDAIPTLPADFDPLSATLGEAVTV